MSWSELNCLNKSIQLCDAFIGHPPTSGSRRNFVSIGCNETRTVCVRLVLNTCKYSRFDYISIQFYSSLWLSPINVLHLSSLSSVTLKLFTCNHSTTTTLHLSNGIFTWTTWVSRYQKGTTSLDLNEARDGGVLGCSGISWTMCEQSAPRPRQISTSTSHHSIFTGQMLFLTSNQQCQSFCRLSEYH